MSRKEEILCNIQVRLGCKIKINNAAFVISQEEYSPEDPANPCVNYPTEEYQSYADCDDHFVRSFLPPGLKPFWTVDNISEATDTFYLEYDLYDKTFAYLGI